MDYAVVRNIVYNTFPRHLSTDVPIDVIIQVILRLDLDAINFKEEHVILLDVNGDKVVPVDVKYNNRKILIKPLEELEQNSHYILEIIGGENGIKTITNQVLEESWKMEFYTGTENEVKPPIITSPSNQTIIRGKNVTFEWETQENIFYYHLQISDSNTFNHILWPSDENINVFDGKATPDFNYENKRYYARIKAVSMLREESSWSEPVQFYVENEEALKEEELNLLDNQTEDPAYYLDSKCKVLHEKSELECLQEALKKEEEKQEPDNILKVKGISIANKTFNIPLNSLKEIHIEFAEPIDPKTINSKTIYLLGERN